MKAIGTDIIGREKEIGELLSILDQTSVIMSSTRRMGKTMILTKIGEIQDLNVKSMLCFVESIQSAEEFVDFLRENLIQQNLIQENGFKSLFNWMNTNLGSKDVGFFKTPDFSKYWKKALNLMMDDLVEKHAGLIILMLDEFPKMLWTMIQNGNHQQATEVLDELRHIRERYEKRSKLRFIYCGSIGMNLVINHLIKRFKYNGAPTNNMHQYIVTEMNPTDATQLVKHLTKKHGVVIDDVLETYLANACSYLPFFIDRIIIQIKISNLVFPISASSIDEIVDEFLLGRGNNNQFNHFTERIDTYYDTEEKRIAHELLRLLSKTNVPLSSEALLNHVKIKIVAEDFEIMKILSDLFEDMYVDKSVIDDSTCYQFRFVLLKKWWKSKYA